jgi:hypothetical protein
MDTLLPEMLGDKPYDPRPSSWPHELDAAVRVELIRAAVRHYSAA